MSVVDRRTPRLALPPSPPLAPRTSLARISHWDRPFPSDSTPPAPAAVLSPTTSPVRLAFALHLPPLPSPPAALSSAPSSVRSSPPRTAPPHTRSLHPAHLRPRACSITDRIAPPAPVLPPGSSASRKMDSLCRADSAA